MNISLFHQVKHNGSKQTKIHNRTGRFLRSANQSNRVSDKVTVLSEKQKSNEESVTRVGPKLRSFDQSRVCQNNGLNDDVKESDVSSIDFLHQYSLFIELF